MALYEPTPTEAILTGAQTCAENLRNKMTDMGDSLVADYASLKDCVANEQINATRAQVMNELGTADAATLQNVATKLRALLAAIDPTLAAKFDTIGKP